MFAKERPALKAEGMKREQSSRSNLSGERSRESDEEYEFA